MFNQPGHHSSRACRILSAVLAHAITFSSCPLLPSQAWASSLSALRARSTRADVEVLRSLEQEVAPTPTESTLRRTLVKQLTDAYDRRANRFDPKLTYETFAASLDHLNALGPDERRLEALRLRRLWAAMGQNEPERAGEFPYTIGLHALMYVTQMYANRKYRGVALPEETNRILREGVASAKRAGLGRFAGSIAFDLATQNGFDADDEQARDDLGKLGVTITHLGDMRTMLRDVSLEDISLSMTINSMAAVLLAMMLAIADEQAKAKGLDPAQYRSEQMRVTIQNDMLKEFVARGTQFVPLDASLRIVRDVLRYVKDHRLRNVFAISIAPYHLREAGATAAQEIAFGIANGIQHGEIALDAGLTPNEYGEMVSFFINIQPRTLEEMAKFEVFRRLWARVMRDGFGATSPRAMQARIQAYGGGTSAYPNKALVNNVRVANVSLAAAWGGVAGIDSFAADEVYAITTDRAARLAIDSRNTLSYETGLNRRVVAPLQGSEVLDYLVDHLEREAWAILEEIRARTEPSESGEDPKPYHEVMRYMDDEIGDASYEDQQRQEQGRRLIVGQNFAKEAPEDKVYPALQITQPNAEAAEQLREQARIYKLGRSNEQLRAISQTFDALRQAAEDPTANQVDVIVEAVKAGATIGEIAGVWRRVYGEVRGEHEYEQSSRLPPEKRLPLPTWKRFRLKMAQLRPQGEPLPRPSHRTGTRWQVLHNHPPFADPKAAAQHWVALLELAETDALPSMSVAVKDSDGKAPPTEEEAGEAALEGIGDLRQVLQALPLARVQPVIKVASYQLPQAIETYRSVAPEPGRAVFLGDAYAEHIMQRPGPISLRDVETNVGGALRQLHDGAPGGRLAINGYSVMEAGASTEQELAAMFYSLRRHVNAAQAAGLTVDEAARHLVLFLGAGNDSADQIAKQRAARRLWKQLMSEWGAQGAATLTTTLFAKTSAKALTREKFQNNIARTAYHTIAAVLGGVDVLQASRYDAPWGGVTSQSVLADRLTFDTQLAVNVETDLTEFSDPVAGSPSSEARTDELIVRTLHTIRVLELLSPDAALEELRQSVDAQRQADEAAMQPAREGTLPEKVVVGRNAFFEDLGLFETLAPQLIVRKDPPDSGGTPPAPSSAAETGPVESLGNVSRSP